MTRQRRIILAAVGLAYLVAVVVSTGVIRCDWPPVPVQYARFAWWATWMALILSAASAIRRKEVSYWAAVLVLLVLWAMPWVVGHTIWGTCQ